MCEEMNDRRPLVSVSCLVYNHEPYLRQCFEGFVIQRTNFKFEVLVHDDASTDGSPEIIREYVERYPHLFKPMFQRVNLYSKDCNSVVRIQRERALGKYFTFCEGDDYWTEPYKLQRQFDFMEMHPDFSFCFHDCLNLNMKTHEMEGASLKMKCSREVLMRELIFKKLHSPTLSMFFRTEEYRLAGEVLDLAPVDDLSASLLAASFGRSYCFCEPMGVYRMHCPGSWSVQKRDRAFYSNYYIKILRFFVAFDRFTKHRFSGLIYRRMLKLGFSFCRDWLRAVL